MFRLFVGIVLGVVIIIFAVQNTATVTYDFLAWSVTAPRALLFILTFLSGMVFAWLITGMGRLRRKKR